MASLEQQYSNWLDKNKASDFTFEDWKRYILVPKLKRASEQISKLKDEEE
ncbi:MAG: hypothetical protein KC414_06020 [Romboutsia sp.]|nr:hypothetical protein [Romboutsia sp.]